MMLPSSTTMVSRIWNWYILFWNQFQEFDEKSQRKSETHPSSFSKLVKCPVDLEKPAISPSTLFLFWPMRLMRCFESGCMFRSVKKKLGDIRKPVEGRRKMRIQVMPPPLDKSEGASGTSEDVNQETLTDTARSNRQNSGNMGRDSNSSKHRNETEEGNWICCELNQVRKI